MTVCNVSSECQKAVKNLGILTRQNKGKKATAIDNKGLQSRYGDFLNPYSLTRGYKICEQKANSLLATRNYLSIPDGYSRWKNIGTPYEEGMPFRRSKLTVHRFA